MFSSLIYTRCRQGVDITKNGQPVTGDGYKVYACTESLFGGGQADLPFLYNAAQMKQPYSDPDFMDDAYLYITPEVGQPFLMCFHPVHFDPNAPGDYAHRPGNFVNQLVLGDFSGRYPCGMVGSSAVWTAKARSEAYYYETPSEPIRAKAIGDTPGGITFEDAGRFVKDGRAQALRAAVAFLIEQYAQPPEQRKYLVIREDNARNIELWIAAIGYAFSPRIAANLPFASRMEKFQTANTYTVNQSGIYQRQKNLQDPNQKLRHYAMIVGLDVRDKASSGVKPLANSPFAMLDGAAKEALFQANTGDDYFATITRFDGAHKEFTGQFLQSFGLEHPSRDLFEFTSAYMLINSDRPAPKELADALGFLCRFSLHGTSTLRETYQFLLSQFPEYLRGDALSAVLIADSLMKIASALGVQGAKAALTGAVVAAFQDRFYGKRTNMRETEAFWRVLKDGPFARDAAMAVMKKETVHANLQAVSDLSCEDVAVFLPVFLDCMRLLGAADYNLIRSVAGYCLGTCKRAKNHVAARKIIAVLFGFSEEAFYALLGTEDKELCRYALDCYLELDGKQMTQASTGQLLDKLHRYGAGELAEVVLLKLVGQARGQRGYADIVQLLASIRWLSADTLSVIYARIDDAAGTAMEEALAKQIQSSKPAGAKCPNSAHIAAVLTVRDVSKRGSGGVSFALRPYVAQGFPSLDDEKIAQNLADALVRVEMDARAWHDVLELLRLSPYSGYLAAFAQAVVKGHAKTPRAFAAYVAFACQDRSGIAREKLTLALAEVNLSEKGTEAMVHLVADKNSLALLNAAMKEASEIRASQKGKSVVSRLFGGFFGKK